MESHEEWVEIQHEQKGTDITGRKYRLSKEGLTANGREILKRAARKLLRLLLGNHLAQFGGCS